MFTKFGMLRDSLSEIFASTNAISKSFSRNISAKLRDFNQILQADTIQMSELLIGLGY